MTDTIVFLQGVSAAGAWVCGLLFFRFWRDTHDALFGYFGAGFWLMATSWTLLGLISPTSDGRPFIYLLRLAAFVLIIVAIAQKNRR